MRYGEDEHKKSRKLKRNDGAERSTPAIELPHKIQPVQAHAVDGGLHFVPGGEPPARLPRDGQLSLVVFVLDPDWLGRWGDHRIGHKNTRTRKQKSIKKKKKQATAARFAWDGDEAGDLTTVSSRSRTSSSPPIL